jgi:BirA family biotin operon repressor/biotin-[acetyl-CoA-carboxylase] ligase
MDWKVIGYESIDSTNLEARRLIESGGEGSGLVVRARHQTAGRGRLQRDWWDLPDRSLLFTLALDSIPGSEATRLACVAAVAAIRGKTGGGPLIKWPNDLVYGRKKVAGVLAEALPASGLTLVGMGINLNYRPGELAYPASSSLLIEEQREWDPDRLLLSILGEVDRREAGGNDALALEYAASLAYLGEPVTVRPPYSVHGEPGSREEPLEGTVRGIDEDGFLLLQSNGAIHRIVAGDLEPTNVTTTGREA